MFNLKKIVTYNYGRSKINSMKTKRFNDFDEKFPFVLYFSVVFDETLNKRVGVNPDVYGR